MAKIRQFGNTWWGKAWLDALEQRALVDPNRLPRGRTYARQDRVQDLELSPGLLRASVAGNSDEPYTTTLSLRELTSSEWDRLLDIIMGKASNVASLLAGEVPPEVAEIALPDRGDLGPECSCPDWAEPCKHAAALCYIAADLFDADPFALLTLRGRGRDDVLTEVRARRSKKLGVDIGKSSDQPRGADPGFSAAAAFRRDPVALDQAAALASRPGTLVTLAVAPSADTGIDALELGDLVRDAAERAWAMLAGGAESGLDLSVGADVVRRAARGDVHEIADATGVPDDELASAVAAWRIGGLAGFTAQSSRPEVAPEDMVPGQRALGARSKIRGNTVSLGTIQLRLDADGRWWRFIADEAIGWLLTDGPADIPSDLV